MRARPFIILLAAVLMLGACRSGPSPETLRKARPPVTTTTTEPPPEGIIVVRITNGAFRPSNLKVDLEQEWIVQFRHEDVAEREYIIEARNEVFPASPLLTPGDVYEVDFSGLDPGIYRYFAFLGNTRIPGSIDTRPQQ